MAMDCTVSEELTELRRLCGIERSLPKEFVKTFAWTRLASSLDDLIKQRVIAVISTVCAASANDQAETLTVIRNFVNSVKGGAAPKHVKEALEDLGQFLDFCDENPVDQTRSAAV